MTVAGAQFNGTDVDLAMTKIKSVLNEMKVNGELPE